ARNVSQRVGPATDLRINEWLASGEALYDSDWLELANLGGFPLSLGGVRITDNPFGNPGGQALAPLSYIAAHGFLKLIADDKAELGPTHLAFTLNAEREEIALFAGDDQLDYVLFWPQSTDVSMGRDPSSSTGFSTFELPTAGLPNGTGDPAYLNGLRLLRALRITEIMYNAIGGNDFDFIELRNIGMEPLDLAGVQFVEGVDFRFGAQVLGPGQNLVLAANASRFTERYGNVPRLAGTYGGRLDNGGETLALQLPPPFDANILTFAFQDTWQKTTDGRGKSLVVINPLTRASTWGNKDAWTYSPSRDGDPDGVSLFPPDHFNDWQSFFGVASSDDADGDGLP
ncbi:MAG: hypothetical protein EOP84_36380, partial [Verrucomicrobiaceae bacterium]